MLTYYSILHFVNNVHSGECLALGLVAVAHPRVYFKLSPRKLALALQLNPCCSESLYRELQQLQCFIPLEQPNTEELLSFENQLDLEFLYQLSLFRKEYLRFSSLKFTVESIDVALFESYFTRYVGSGNVNVERLNT
jgi:hypothetical protein